MSLSQAGQNGDVGIERIGKNADELTGELAGALKRIEKISSQTQLLSINAKIRAARAGTAGRAFGVVADEVESAPESRGKSGQSSLYRRQFWSSTGRLG
jgi:methyl-accepting chemotaxis protein